MYRTFARADGWVERLEYFVFLLGEEFTVVVPENDLKTVSDVV